MLWEIATTPHKLLGTMHNIPANTQWPVWVDKSYVGMKRFVFERDEKIPPDDKIGVDKTRKHLTFPNASDTYNRAAKMLASIGMTRPVESYKPWMLSLIIAAAFQKHWGFARDFGPDKRLRDFSDKNKLSVKSLESPNNCFQRLNSASEASDFGFQALEETLSDLELGSGKLLTKRLLHAWLEADLRESSAILTEEIRQMPSFMDALILKRNQDWLPVATKLANEKLPTLFIVGSFHTVGSGSLIEYMESAGFKFNFIAGK
jgi:uncharacterized protein YbaP (TraB family)